MNAISTQRTISHDGYTIHRIVETDGEFLVAFSGLASCYRSNAPGTQQTIRAAHAAGREVDFSADRHCDIVSVTMSPPRGLARRAIDQLHEIGERLFDLVTRRNTRWIRDAQRIGRNPK